MKNLDNNSNIYVYLDDFPIYVKKGFIFYKKKSTEINRLISHDFLYYYSKDSIEKIKIKESTSAVYEHLEKQDTSLVDKSLLLKNKYNQLISSYRQYIDKEKINSIPKAIEISKDIFLAIEKSGMQYRETYKWDEYLYFKMTAENIFAAQDGLRAILSCSFTDGAVPVFCIFPLKCRDPLGPSS